MMIRRSMTVAVLLAAVLTMGVGIAEAQTQTVRFLRITPKGEALDYSFIDSGVTIVVLQNTGESYTSPLGAGQISGVTFSLYDAVVIDPGARGAPALRIQIGLFESTAPLPAGTRLALAFADTLESCVDTDKQKALSCSHEEASFSLRLTTMEIVSPGNSSPLLFTSNATVNGDTLGVITGQQDEDGFAEAVLTTKGQKPTFATLLTHQWLEPADRIVDIIQLDYDPETGIALYGGFLEY